MIIAAPSFTNTPTVDRTSTVVTVTWEVTDDCTRVVDPHYTVTAIHSTDTSRNIDATTTLLTHTFNRGDFDQCISYTFKIEIHHNADGGASVTYTSDSILPNPEG